MQNLGLQKAHIYHFLSTQNWQKAIQTYWYAKICIHVYAKC